MSNKLSALLTSPTKLIQIGWPKLTKFPGGNKIFSSIVSRLIPYTGSIKPIVMRIEKEQASVMLKDRRSVRNHLNSIHALALANLGEFTSGLSVISQLPEAAQAILVKLEIEYLKKARGDVTAEAMAQLPAKIESESEFRVLANITNAKNEVVTKVYATWKVRIK